MALGASLAQALAALAASRTWLQVLVKEVLVGLYF